MKIEITHRIVRGTESERFQLAVLGHLEKIMATLDDVLAQVTTESSQIDSLATLVAGIKQQLADVLSGVVLPAGTQEKIDALFAAVEANKQKVADAITANT